MDLLEAAKDGRRETLWRRETAELLFVAVVKRLLLLLKLVQLSDCKSFCFYYAISLFHTRVLDLDFRLRLIKSFDWEDGKEKSIESKF